MNSHTGPWPSPTESPTVFSNVLVPRATPSCAPDQLVIQLTTTLLIPTYSRFYDAPIASFTPTYLSLADGSLVTPPFIEDLVNSNVSLFVMGILTMLFARNIFVSGDYLRRANIKRKSLFKVLFVSQLLAVPALVPIIVSQFNQFLNCTTVSIVSCVATAISLALLITWILGYKAFRCLNNSKLVLVCLLFLLAASAVVFVFEMLGLQAERRLSGGCVRTSDPFFTKIYIIIQLVESFFISCCFFYAVFRSRASTVSRTRISIRLSLDNADLTQDSRTGNRRGRDYVPKLETEKRPLFTQERSNCLFSKFFSPHHDDHTRRLHKSSTTHDSSAPMRTTQSSAVRITEPQRPASPTFSTHTRLSRYIPRMELFRDVMRDELCYTTFITTSCVIVAVFALIAVNFKNSLTVSGWIFLNWAVISLLAIHSFGRVIRRHERDIILQEPRSWQPRTRADHRALNPSSYNRRWRNNGDLDDSPFSETRGLTESRGSWSSFSSHQSEPPPLEKKVEMPLPSLLIEEYSSRAGFLDHAHDHHPSPSYS